jgi:predicted Holliday junction resolvase-like endonuclease
MLIYLLTAVVLIELVLLLALVFSRQRFQMVAARRAVDEALAQLNRWRETEVEAIRAQQAELARTDALLQLEGWRAESELAIRQDAARRSHGVTVGKMTEHLVPFLPGFNFDPRDARFLGTPVDFLVFDGLGEGEVRSITFVEVKTGRSGLSPRERQVRDAVLAGRVEWYELRSEIDLTG